MKRLLERLRPMLPALGMLGLVGLAYFFVYANLASCVHSPKGISLEVERGMGFLRVMEALDAEGLVCKKGFLRVLMSLRNGNHRVQAGSYHFPQGESPNSLVEALVRGRTVSSMLTIPEGFSLREIALLLEKKKILPAKTFLQATRDEAWVASLNLPYGRGKLEGMLFPDTYRFSEGVSAREIIREMLRIFMKKAHGPLEQHARKMGLEPYQALVLASIVEKETGADFERRKIAGVFYNRLRVGIKLGSDPTVIYGVPNFDGNLTRRHLRTDTPFNTYTRYGLPPTPIANPGLASIESVLFPETVDFLYFVSKGDGTHFFSKDLKTHNQAVQRYQIKGRRNGG